MATFFEIQQPGSGGIRLLARSWHTQRTVADDAGAVKQAACTDVTVYKPASGLVRFEKPKIEEEQGEFHEEDRRSIQVHGS